MRLWVKISIIVLSIMCVSMLIFSALLINTNSSTNLRRVIDEATAESLLFATYINNAFNSYIDTTTSITAQKSIAEFIITDFISSYYRQGEFTVYYSNSIIYNENSTYIVDFSEEIFNSEYVIFEDGDEYIIAVSGSIAHNIDLIMTKDITGVITDINDFTLRAVLINMIIISATAVSLLFSVRHMLKPLNKLKNNAKLIAKGVYDASIDIRTKDELSDVAAAFNFMTLSVKEKIDEIEKTSHKLEELSENRRVFIANLTHELKTPMTSIIGYSEALMYHNIGDEQKEKALYFLHDECKRLERLSQKLMSILVSENSSPEFNSVAIKELFCDVINTTLGRAEKKQVQIKTQTETKSVYCDKDLMISALANLVDNAISASETYGKVDVLAYDTKDGVVFEVVDYGKGIEESEIKKIMRPFYRSDNSAKEGVGLGLSLVHTICAIHNATFEMTSEVGKKTCAKIIFKNNTEKQ